jgi:hypothetical protein
LEVLAGAFIIVPKLTAEGIARSAISVKSRYPLR